MFRTSSKYGRMRSVWQYRTKIRTNNQIGRQTRTALGRGLVYAVKIFFVNLVLPLEEKIFCGFSKFNLFNLDQFFFFLLVQILDHLGGTNTISCMKLKEKRWYLTVFVQSWCLPHRVHFYFKAYCCLCFSLLWWQHEFMSMLVSWVIQPGRFQLWRTWNGLVIRSLTRASFLGWF